MMDETISILESSDSGARLHANVLGFLSHVLLFLTPKRLVDYSSPVSSVHGILQARILKWVAIPFSRGSSQLWIESGSLALQVDSLLAEPPGKQPQVYPQSSLSINPQILLLHWRAFP